LFKCIYCDKSYKTLYSLKTHVKRVHLSTGICPECGHKFKKLTNHLERLKEVDKIHAALYYFATSQCKRCKRSLSKYAKIAYEICKVE